MRLLAIFILHGNVQEVLLEALVLVEGFHHPGLTDHSVLLTVLHHDLLMADLEEVLVEVSEVDAVQLLEEVSDLVRKNLPENTLTFHGS
jgi:hypothetical protein